MLSINKNRCNLCGECINTCPFGALTINEGRIDVSAACRMCRMCVKKCPQKAIVVTDGMRKRADRAKWQGIMVFVEYMEGEIHPVTIELIGKAKELASKINHPVYCIFIGYNILDKAQKLLAYGVDKVFVYDNEVFEYYREDLYSNAFEDCINNIKPSIVLVGATAIGRSLAPRLSTRFRTGLTADCTVLDIKENTDLVQIRPAFGGNIMAQIVTEYSRPQFATVRYKVMEKAKTVKSLTDSEIEEGVEICKLAKGENEVPNRDNRDYSKGKGKFHI
ncbi:MAG: hypothetical protein ACFWUE_00155 [Xylanivirga thermophila]|jgi:electron transfer flavoprotein alpha subunit